MAFHSGVIENTWMQSDNIVIVVDSDYGPEIICD